jgi:hypothetical protein
MINSIETNGGAVTLMSAFDAEELMLARALQLSAGEHMEALTAMKKMDDVKRQRSDKLLQAFFDTCIAVGEWAVSEGLMDLDDLFCGEPHLYIGIPALVMIEVALPPSLSTKGASIIYGDVLENPEIRDSPDGVLSVAQPKNSGVCDVLAESKDTIQAATTTGAEEAITLNDDDDAQHEADFKEVDAKAVDDDSTLVAASEVKEAETTAEIKEAEGGRTSPVTNAVAISEAADAKEDLAAKEGLVEAKLAVVPSSGGEDHKVAATVEVEGEGAAMDSATATTTAEVAAVCAEVTPLEEKTFCFLLSGKQMWCDCKFGEGENAAKMCVDDDDDRRLEAVCQFTDTIRQVREMMSDCDMSEKQLFLLRRMVMGLADGEDCGAPLCSIKDKQTMAAVSATNGSDSTGSGTADGAEDGCSELKLLRQRTKSITTLVAQICSDVAASATDISQMPVFKRRFHSVLEEILDTFDTPPSDVESADGLDMSMTKEPNMDLSMDSCDLSMSTDELEMSTATQSGVSVEIEAQS